MKRTPQIKQKLYWEWQQKTDCGSVCVRLETPAKYSDTHKNTALDPHDQPSPPAHKTNKIHPNHTNIVHRNSSVVPHNLTVSSWSTPMQGPTPTMQHICPGQDEFNREGGLFWSGKMNLRSNNNIIQIKEKVQWSKTTFISTLKKNLLKWM